ncbi:MAG: GNAT family N-acetyltransferase [Candidatus Gracilibacteria bacterium]
MKSIKVVLAKKNNSRDISRIVKVLDTENYFFSNVKDIDKYIQKKQCYAAIQENKVIGAMVLRPEDQSYEIHSLSSKKRGAGRALIDAAVQKCAEDNIPKLWCWSLVRYNAKGFYEKMGFKESFLLKKQWYGEDCYFFGREVGKAKTIYFITGASGVGKTTLTARLKKKYANRAWSFLHFDSIGVPSVAEMKKEFGSPSGWQEAKTYEWIDKLINEHSDEKVFLEGQVNLQFIHNGFQKHDFKNYKIILIDCGKEEMAYRLTHKRGQPELLTDDMKNWLKFLRNQAKALEVPVVDTSNLSEEEALKEFEKVVGL